MRQMASREDLGVEPRCLKEIFMLYVVSDVKPLPLPMDSSKIYPSYYFIGKLGLVVFQRG